MRRATLCVALGVGLAAHPAGALTLCMRRAGTLVGRPGACKPKETAVDPAALGLQRQARWAVIGDDGTILAQSGGLTVTVAAAGNYVVGFGESVAAKAIVATPAITTADTALRGTLAVGICGGGTAGLTFCPLGMDTDQFVLVGTANPANTLAASHAFFIAVL